MTGADILGIREGLEAGGLEREKALARLGQLMYDSAMLICGFPDTSHFVAWSLVKGVRAKWEGRENNVAKSS